MFLCPPPEMRVLVLTMTAKVCNSSKRLRMTPMQSCRQKGTIAVRGDLNTEIDSDRFYTPFYLFGLQDSRCDESAHAIAAEVAVLADRTFEPEKPYNNGALRRAQVGYFTGKSMGQ